MKYQRNGHSEQVVEAFQWTGGPDQKEDPLWIVNAMKIPFEEEGSFYFISTTAILNVSKKNGHIVKCGDFLIRGDAGRIFSLDAETFNKMYTSLGS